MPVDEQPIDAARHAADALARLGHEVGEATPDWDDEDFPGSLGDRDDRNRPARDPSDRAAARPCRSMPSRLEPATREWAVQSAPVTLIDYLEAAERLWAFSRRLIGSWPPDAVLLTPTLTRLPAEIAALRSQAGVTDDAVRFSALVRIWNVTGQPAITVPLYETPEGVPVGIQLVGPPGRDELVISLAAQLEEAVGRRPKGLALEQTTYAHTT